MSVTIKEKIESLKKDEFFYSFEFFPPKTESGLRNLLLRMGRMSVLNPLFVTVTWGAGGSTLEKTLELIGTCQRDLGLTSCMHLTCTNTSLAVIDDALAKAKQVGIRNILALRGDPPAGDEFYTPDPDSHFEHAVDLVKYIKQQHGDYFCIGVAAYPEGHVEGSDDSEQDFQKDLPYLVDKINAGADFVVTQLFYDAAKFVEFQQLLSSLLPEKRVIVIPGLMPINNFQLFNRASKLSHASIPAQLLAKFQGIEADDDKVKEVGVQCLDEIIDTIVAKTDIRGFHFYTLNLEKSVTQIINRSRHLSKVFLNNDLENAIDDGDDVDDNTVRGPARRYSNQNRLIGKSGSFTEDPLSAASSLATPRKTIVQISLGQGVLGRDATWDDFPNGRFGDSRSPAFGEIDGYGPSLKMPKNKVYEYCGHPVTLKDISKMFVSYLTSKIDANPWSDIPLNSESALIQEQLIQLNELGCFTLSSQPATDGTRSSDKIFGWGPPNGYVYQKLFVEFFVGKDKFELEILPKLEADPNVTYYYSDLKNNFKSSSAELSKNAITWGVFPNREIVQTTIIEDESFKAWVEELFKIWVEWQRLYPVKSDSYQFLDSFVNNCYLVNVIHHDYKEEFALWDLLLE